MAEVDARPHGAASCSVEEQASVPQSGLSAIAELLRQEIMADVEARLSEKAESLWKRGQAELGKLQQERKDIATSVAELQKSQESLITEQTQMHSALLDIATKMEFVALEMQEALRAVGKLDGPATNGGMLPEAALTMPPALPISSELMADLSALGFPPQGLEPDGPPPGLVLQTPPRMAAQPDATAAAGPSIAPLPGSPAVLLSLASVLPSAPATSPEKTLPPPGATRLHIADCLDIKTSDPLTQCEGKTSATRAATGSPVSSSSSLLASGVNGSSSSAGSPSRVEVGSPISADATSAGFGVDLTSKAAGGTLRADAPVFVPGGTFAT